MLWQALKKGIDLAQHVGFVGPKQVMIGIGQPNHARRWHPALESFRLLEGDDRIQLRRPFARRLIRDRRSCGKA
jgi:hypothetical protein